jgi:hypothetical protein
MPSDAAREIADLALIINRLWGVLSGAPIAREVMAIAWDDQTATWGQVGHFSTEPVQGTASSVLVRADPEDDLGVYDSLYEVTHHPCEFLWGPGTWPDAQAWLQQERPVGDEATILDRLFMLRYHDSRLYLPQTAPVAAGLDSEQQEGIWYLIRADSPNVAFSHQRQVLAGVAGHSRTGHCRCPVETLASGALHELLSIAAAVGADINPRQVPDVRVPISRMPRWNEILGEGSWTAPPI